MKTVTDFKRRLKVGAKVHTTFHAESFRANPGDRELSLRDKDMGIREISKVQSNSFALDTPRTDGGSNQNSWCGYPKASECEFPNENTIIIFDQDFRHGHENERIKLLTYTFID